MRYHLASENVPMDQGPVAHAVDQDAVDQDAVDQDPVDQDPVDHAVDQDAVDQRPVNHIMRLHQAPQPLIQALQSITRMQPLSLT